jgi:putative FmdB family regulatory protein
MPMYEYRCQVCNSEFEQLVRSMATCADVRCPNCGSKDVKKAWSVFGMGTGGGRLSHSPDAASSCSPTGT